MQATSDGLAYCITSQQIVHCFIRKYTKSTANKFVFVCVNRLISTRVCILMIEGRMKFVFIRICSSVYGNNKHSRYLKTKSCLLALCDQISARNFVLQTCLQQFWFCRLNLEWTVAINCNVTKSSFIKPSLIELTRFLIESVGKILLNEE